MDFIAGGGLKVIFSDENALVRALELLVQFHLLGPAGDGAATVTSPSTSSGKQALTLFWRPLLSL